MVAYHRISGLESVEKYVFGSVVEHFDNGAAQDLSSLEIESQVF